MELPDDMLAWKKYDAKQIPSVIKLEPFFYDYVKKGSTVLDFGCAWGRIAFQMQEAGLTVTGIDINKEAIESAKEFSRATNKKFSSNASFYHADALDLSQFPDNHFDACTMIAFMVTQVNPDHRPRVLSEARRVLKQGGILYLADFGDNSENPKYAQRYKEHYAQTKEWRTFIVTDTHAVHGKELYRCHHYTKEELIDLISPGFTIEKIEEPTYHTGNSDAQCIVIIARK